MNIIVARFILITLWCLGVLSTFAQRPSNSARVNINWEETEYVLSPDHWSVNDYELIHEDKVIDPGYVEFGRLLSPRIVRVHHAGIADTWTDSTTRSWREEVVVNNLKQAMNAFPGAKFMINPICHWPAWLAASNKILSPTEEEELIQLFREFASIIKRHDIPVHSIEIFNEREEMYERAGKLDALWHLFNRVVEVLREEVPGMRLGGPALTWAKKTWVESFLDISGDKIDMFTWHNYGSGSPENSNQLVAVKAPDHIDSLARYATSELRERGLGHVQTYLTEYNVQWVWTPFEVRHANNVGAVFQSLVVKRMAALGLDGVMVWHLKGHSYGLIDAENVTRSTGHLYAWGSKYLTGKVARYTSSNPGLEIMPVTREDGVKSVLIINKSGDGLDLKNSFIKQGVKGPSIWQISDDSLQPVQIQDNTKIIRVKPYSLTLVTSKL